MYLTDETMDEIGYEITQYAAMDGRDDIERFVTESDYERVTECEHPYGVSTFELHRWTFECTTGNCDYVVEVLR